MYGPLCSVETNTETFHRFGLTFVRRCTVVKNTFAKERRFSDNLIVALLFFKYSNFREQAYWRSVKLLFPGDFGRKWCLMQWKM